PAAAPGADGQGVQPDRPGTAAAGPLGHPVRVQALQGRPRPRALREARDRRLRLRRGGPLPGAPGAPHDRRGARPLAALGAHPRGHVPQLAGHAQGRDPNPPRAMSKAAAAETLVVLPTFNERENLATAVAGIRSLGYHVLVVDDASPDGTGEIACGLAEAD